MNLNNESFHSLEPQEEYIHLDMPRRNFSVGLLKDSHPIKEVVLITPDTIGKLVEANVQVWLQRGFCDHTTWIDLDYADMGAIILDDPVSIIRHSDIITKLEPFDFDEIELFRPGQIMISSVILNELTVTQFNFYKKMQISAFGLNMIKGKNEHAVFEDILLNTLSERAISVALGELLLSILYPLMYSGSLKDSIQTSATLMQGIYCYNGLLCNREIGEKLELPWKDILSICWNWN